jgi:hypothetical protein
LRDHVVRDAVAVDVAALQQLLVAEHQRAAERDRGLRRAVLELRQVDDHRRRERAVARLLVERVLRTVAGQQVGFAVAVQILGLELRHHEAAGQFLVAAVVVFDRGLHRHHHRAERAEARRAVVARRLLAERLHALQRRQHQVGAPVAVEVAHERRQLRRVGAQEETRAAHQRLRFGIVHLVVTGPDEPASARRIRDHDLDPGLRVQVGGCEQRVCRVAQPQSAPSRHALPGHAVA